MKTNHLFLSLPLILLTPASSIAQVANDKRPDPLQQLQKAFPDTVELKDHGKLLEFCPDGTCDGFVTSGNVPLPTLMDFAYLYVFFFSDNITLDDWKGTEDAKKRLPVFSVKPNISLQECGYVKLVNATSVPQAVNLKFEGATLANTGEPSC